MYTYNRITSICIDLSKLKLFVFVFMALYHVLDKLTSCKKGNSLVVTYIYLREHIVNIYKYSNILSSYSYIT